jgi:hypothetical protein
MGVVDTITRGAITKGLNALLPWANRSQHDAWRQGYIEGLKEKTRSERERERIGT